MEALTRANAGLLRRLEAIERRLGRMEERLGLAGEEPVPQPEPQAPGLQIEPEALIEEGPAAPAAPVHTREPALETRLGLTWVNRVAVITCILAVAFFFKYAIDNQWIGEMGRVALGVLAGLMCLAGAEGLSRRGHRVYAQGIAGLGIAIFYLSFHAAFAFYRLLPQGPAFALMALTTLMAAAAALRYGAKAIAILGLLGGYATPVLLSTGADRPWFFLGYLLLLNGGSLSLARLRQWRVLEDLALPGSVLLYGVWLSHHAPWRVAPDLGWQLPGWLFLPAYYALFAWAGREYLTCLAHVLTCWAAALLWPDRTWPPLASLAALSAAALALADRFSWRYLPPVALGSWLAGYLAWERQSESGVPAETALVFHAISFTVFLAWLPWRLLGRRAPARSADLALATGNAALFFGMFYFVLEGAYDAWQGFATAALAAAHLGAGWLMWRGQPPESRDTRPPLAALGLALALLTLAIPIHFSGFRITMAWALEAAALAWLAARTQSPALRAGTLLVFLMVSARLLLIDLEALAGQPAYWLIANQRFLTFVTAAASFGAAAWWTRQAGARSAPVGGAYYVAAHATLLGGLCLEACEWVARSGAQNIQSGQSIAVSVLAALYAIGLVAAGVVTRRAIDRMLGLALVTLVVAKLYLYDVWLLGRLHRIAAFAALGVLLLALSFIYSRYRAVIEGLWQDRHDA